MKQVIIRRNKMFIINKDILKPKILTTDYETALYAAIYTEFLGAVDNPEYSKLTSLEKFNKVNEFANKWLNTRGLI